MSGRRPTIRHTYLVGVLRPQNGTSSSHVGEAIVVASRRHTTHLDRWRKSGTFRRIASDSAKTNLRAFDAAPRCGAKRKRDGEFCEKPVVKGRTKCRLHGGATPRGRQWHVVQFPADEAKFNRKLCDQKRYAAKRAARLAAMTPDQRAKHDAWHRTHRPGVGAARNAERERARQNAEARALLTVGPFQPVSGPELARVLTALTAVRAKLARLDAKAGKLTDDDQGIFS